MKHIETLAQSQTEALALALFRHGDPSEALDAIRAFRQQLGVTESEIEAGIRGDVGELELSTAEAAALKEPFVTAETLSELDELHAEMNQDGAKSAEERTAIAYAQAYTILEHLLNSKLESAENDEQADKLHRYYAATIAARAYLEAMFLVRYGIELPEELRVATQTEYPMGNDFRMLLQAPRYVAVPAAQTEAGSASQAVETIPTSFEGLSEADREAAAKIQQIASEGGKESLGRALRTARLHRNMTQSEVAQAAGGYSVSYMSAVERGQIRPSLQALALLAKGLGFPVSVFFSAQVR